MDSLYLSHQGELFTRVESQLNRLKLLAQSDDPRQHAQAHFRCGDHNFEVSSKGGGGWSYILLDNAFQIKISRNASQLPMIYAKLNSRYISSASLDTVVEDFQKIVRRLGEPAGEPMVSRADLFVDYQTTVELVQFRSADYITKALDFRYFERKPDFTGLSVASGSDLMYRLYDKTFEQSSKPDMFFVTTLSIFGSPTAGKQVKYGGLNSKRGGKHY